MSGTFVLVICFIALSSLTRASATSDKVRITAVANVTLRATPAATSPAIAQLPLGTEIVESGPAGLDKTWVQVRLPDAREGWVQSNLTRELDAIWRWPVFDRIIGERLSRKGDGFPAMVELVSFIERVAPEYTDKDGRARIELARLKALAAAAAAIPSMKVTREPYASWVGARQNDVMHDGIGDRWMVQPDLIWKTHATHATAAAADDIAWFAVTTGMAGECEGEVSCYLAFRNMMEGEYLRRHPAGRHAADSVNVIVETIDQVAPAGKLAPMYTLERGSCGDMTKAVDAMAAAVKDTRTPARDKALAGLAAAKKLCGIPE